MTILFHDRHDAGRHLANKLSPWLERDDVIVLAAATGANMRAAISAAAQQRPARIVVALPVASTQAFEMLKQHADDVVCLHRPAMFLGVGQAYSDFSQTSDGEVLELLEKARHWGKGHVSFNGGRKHVRSGL